MAPAPPPPATYKGVLGGEEAGACSLIDLRVIGIPQQWDGQQAGHIGIVIINLSHGGGSDIVQVCGQKQHGRLG